MKGKDEGLLEHEESATLWLWAYQELLEWDNKITWLFSPVTGKKKYPGDLWGVDEHGNLVLVETKRVSGQSKQDPFLDFLEFEKAAIFPSRDDLFLRSKKLLKDEVKFITESRPFFENGNLPIEFHRGIVPYSSKRAAVRRWRHLYSEVIMPMLLNQDKLLSDLDKNLTEYSERKEAIHYFGFVLTADIRAENLSRAGKEHFVSLQKIAGIGRVHFSQITAHNESPDMVCLKSIRRL